MKFEGTVHTRPFSITVWGGFNLNFDYLLAGLTELTERCHSHAYSVSQRKDRD